MPAKKKARIEPIDEKAVASWIAKHDDLIGTDKVTITELFNSVIHIKSFKEKKYDPSKHGVVETGVEYPAEWSVFRKALEERTAASPLWFVQLRQEDLLLEPDGTIGEHVECFVVIESPKPTLAPRHYIVAEPLPDADAEDHVPERIYPLAEQNVKWNPITKDDGSSINAYILQRKAMTFGFGAASNTNSNSNASNPAPSAATTGFGFPSTTTAPAAAAPAGFSFGNNNTNASTGGSGATAPISFGFGASSSSAPAAALVGNTMQFSFGAATPSTATTTTSNTTSAAPAMSFGFGATSPKPADTPAAPTTTTTTTTTTPATNTAPLAVSKPKIDVDQILFTVWSPKEMKGAITRAKEGCRIVLEDQRIPHMDKPVKLVMQDDVKEKPKDAAKEWVLKKVFARRVERIKDFDKWMEDSPEMSNMPLIEYLQKTREKILKEEAKSDDVEGSDMTYEQMCKSIAPAVEEKLAAACARRAPVRQAQVERLEEITQLMKESKLCSKEDCTIRKFYPANDKVLFRPFGKVSGISGPGETAVCTPPAYVFVNPLLQQNKKK